MYIPYSLDTISPGLYSGANANANVAATWTGMVFTSPFAKTLNEVRLYIASITGTPTSALTAKLYGQTNQDGTAVLLTHIESKTRSGALTGATWNDITGFTTALTTGRRYCIFFKNTHATPASNYFTHPYFASPVVFGQSSRQFSIYGAYTTNDGSTFATQSSTTAMRLKFSDGTYYGVPLATCDVTSNTYSIYSTREFGSMFTAPTKMSVIGMHLAAVSKIGTPTGMPRLRYYTGDGTKTLEETVDAWPNNAIQGTWNGYFASPRTIDAGTICNVVGGETTQSDTISNSYRPTFIVWDSDSNSQAMLPFSQKSVYYDGSAWSNPANVVTQAGFILEPGNEFPASGGGGGGGLLLPRSVNGV